jgi:DDE superfamily endonuclease
VAARAPAREPRPHAGEAPRGFEEQSGIAVSASTVGREIARLPGSWPLKKVPDSPRARRGAAGPVAVAGFPLRREEARVLKGESGFHTSMDRLRAPAPRGERAYGEVPRKWGRNQTLIASITLEGAVGESVSIEGATDSELFETYVERFLAPTLSSGQVVVLDGLGAHRTHRVKELVEARGADLLFLPPYSPDLNPIEEAFRGGEGHRQEGRGANMRNARRDRGRGALGRHVPGWTRRAGSPTAATNRWINCWEYRCDNSGLLEVRPSAPRRRLAGAHR